MKTQFHVTVKEYKKISSLPDSWTPNDFRSILQLTDFGDDADISDTDIQDMAIMALQDMEAEEAADLVAKYRLGEKLNNGQRQELIHEMQEDEIWEEYGDMTLHEDIFNISTVMHQAFPKVFPDTEAIRVVLEISPLNSEAKNQLAKISESLICRMIADGMSEHSILYRLFDEQLLGQKFPESENIVWKYEEVSQENEALSLTIVSTEYWLKELRDVENYQSSAYADY